MTPKEAFIKVAGLCARQEKCIFDIEKKLRDWEVSPGDISAIIHQLVEEKFIDESRYIKVYVKDKFTFNHWGKIKIRYQLKAKNIYGNLVEEALSEIDDELYSQSLVRLLNQKNNKLKEPDAYKRKASLVRFASSRGFEPNLIYNVIEDLSL